MKSIQLKNAKKALLVLANQMFTEINSSSKFKNIVSESIHKQISRGIRFFKSIEEKTR